MKTLGGILISDVLGWKSYWKKQNRSFKHEHRPDKFCNSDEWAIKLLWSCYQFFSNPGRVQKSRNAGRDEFAHGQPISFGYDCLLHSTTHVHHLQKYWNKQRIQRLVWVNRTHRPSRLFQQSHGNHHQPYGRAASPVLLFNVASSQTPVRSHCRRNLVFVRCSFIFFLQQTLEDAFLLTSTLSCLACSCFLMRTYFGLQGSKLERFPHRCSQFRSTTKRRKFVVKIAQQRPLLSWWGSH